MKVKELIAALQMQDQEAIVVMPGYEHGVDELQSVSSHVVELNVNSNWWVGKHEIDSTFPFNTEIPATHANAVLLD